MSDLKLYELPPSPNNAKARIALGYKQLKYERHPLELDGFPGDRSSIVEISGQPRTPVLQHGDRVIFDSGAILRYLEANFRQTPPLFSTDYDEMGAIEQWEWFARARLSGPVGITFRQAFADDVDLEAMSRADELMRELTESIEGRLAKSAFLVGDRLTAADVTAAPLVNLAMLKTDESSGPIVKFFVENLKLGEDRDRTRDWVRRVMAHDGAGAE